MQIERGNPPAVICRGITKAFGSVKANDGIDLRLEYGEILALLGENGSGKTTLVNMLCGIYHPDSGEILVNGCKTSIQSPSGAMNLGIGMIHQHFKLVNVFSAMENVEMGNPGRKLPPKQLREKIERINERIGVTLDPQKKIRDMSVGEKQTVEIVKVLYRGARILILDEPTAVLTPQETDKLFEILCRMRDEGNAIVIITHKLNEVMQISDRVSILRKGKNAGDVSTGETDERQLAEMMVGRAVNLAMKRSDTRPGEEILRVQDLTVEKADGTRGLDGVSFHLREGEILGVAGVAGSGQKELCEAVMGLAQIKAGRIVYKGKDITHKTPGQLKAMGAGVSLVPEDRLGMGLAPSMGMVDNMLLKTYHQSKGAFVDREPAKAAARELIQSLDIKTPGPETPVRLLSGGNVQKVLLGREIHSNPSLLLAAYPVRGLDIQSAHMIYELINRQKEKGVGVLFVGEDLDVLLELCDRILVLCHGSVTGIVDAERTSKEQVGLMMAGVSHSGKEAAHA